jgi:Sec-independent protein secretion pathway component TatC
MIPLVVLYELSIVLASAFGSPPEETVRSTKPASEGSGPGTG